MTFLEKAKYDHNISNEDHMIQDLCPCDFGYEAKIKCKAIIGADAKDKAYICMRCWEREMPGIETKVDKEEEWFNRGFDEGKSEGVLEGFNESWELARAILGIKNKDNRTLMARELSDIYGTNDLLEIFELTPQEALAKLKAYEEARGIKVGDIIRFKDSSNTAELYVTQIGYENWIYAFDITNGHYYSNSSNVYVKTGKNVPLERILEQIGE